MVAVADTGFIASLYLEESTSQAADAALGTERAPLLLTPLAVLELRNAFNRSVQRQRITTAQRDALWQDVEADIASGFLVPTPVASNELHEKARQLSDRYTPTLGTRSLDLLHIAAALVLGAKEFFSFDDKQRKAAAGEGLKVKP
ncbi:MAG TPA: type II toxin-antitoxin system VapC family toxin [Verrucomicrobiae bacterium]|jgi:predicted nucleic acid-binding protein|nr:type II toxin-antitoxin system VapC family toxin [Verrucomicrobiae bacterium]